MARIKFAGRLLLPNACPGIYGVLKRACWSRERSHRLIPWLHRKLRRLGSGVPVAAI